MTIDVLVHPFHGSWDYGCGDDDAYFSYLSALMEHIRNKSPILVRSESQEIKHLSIPPERTFFSISLSCPNTERGYMDYGYVHPDEWKRFTEFFQQRSDERVRVHGCNFGECTLNFAGQLLGFLDSGKHFGRWKTGEDMEEDGRALEDLEQQGRFAESKIKYGIVLAPPLPHRARIIEPCHEYPHGNANYQLLDEETQVHTVII